MPSGPKVKVSAWALCFVGGKKEKGGSQPNTVLSQGEEGHNQPQHRIKGKEGSNHGIESKMGGGGGGGATTTPPTMQIVKQTNPQFEHNPNNLPVPALFIQRYFGVG